MNIQKLSLCLLASSALAGTGLAAGPLSTTVTPPAVKIPKVGGLSINLETSAFNVAIPAKPAATATTAAPTDDSKPGPGIAVSALIANKGKDPVAVTFDSAEAAKRQVTINLYNSAGELKWSSDSDLAAGADVEATLGRGKAWRRMVRVPLVIDNAPLPVGSYVVQALVGLYSDISATAPLEIVDGSTTPPPTDGGTTTTDPKPPTGGTNPPPPPPPPKDGTTTPPTDGTSGGTPPPPPPPTDGGAGSGTTTGGTNPPPPPPPPPTGSGTNTGTTPPPPPPPTGGTTGSTTGTNPPPPPPPPTGSTTGTKLPPPPPPPTDSTTGTTTGTKPPPPPPGGTAPTA